MWSTVYSNCTASARVGMISKFDRDTLWDMQAKPADSHVRTLRKANGCTCSSIGLKRRSGVPASCSAALSRQRRCPCPAAAPCPPAHLAVSAVGGSGGVLRLSRPAQLHSTHCILVLLMDAKTGCPRQIRCDTFAAAERAVTHMRLRAQRAAHHGQRGCQEGDTLHGTHHSTAARLCMTALAGALGSRQAACASGGDTQQRGERQCREEHSCQGQNAGQDVCSERKPASLMHTTAPAVKVMHRILARLCVS